MHHHPAITSETREKLSSLSQELDACEIQLMETFIQEGPESLRRKLGISTNTVWDQVFDRLIFQKGVVKHCVLRFLPYFKHLVSEHGPYVLRSVFGIEARKYDQVFENIFDLVAVGHSSLYDHVYQNRHKFAQSIRKGNAKNLRSQLCIEAKRYDGLWQELLEVLMKATCEELYSESTFDRGLAAFSMIMNQTRTQRSLRSYSKMWEFSTEKGQ
jgi:hypothetical protein